MGFVGPWSLVWDLWDLQLVAEPYSLLLGSYQEFLFVDVFNCKFLCPERIAWIIFCDICGTCSIFVFGYEEALLSDSQW